MKDESSGQLMAGFDLDLSLRDRMACWAKQSREQFGARVRRGCAGRLPIAAMIAIGIAALMSCLTPTGASAAETSFRQLGRVSISLNHSITRPLPVAFKDVFVGAADIADLVPVSDREIYILGKKIGTTNISFFDEQKRLLGILDVEVTPDIRLIESKIRAAAPAARNIKVSSAGGSVVLSGVVPDAPTAERAASIASAFAKGAVINTLQIASPQQILLEVRVIEASRNAGRELGVQWELSGVKGSGGRGTRIGFDQLPSGSTSFGNIFANILRTGSINLDMTIQALEEQGLVRRLANPNLSALSGSTANFLAGGEFPVPVSASNSGGVSTTAIQFKRFGVMLEFTPTVLDNNVINLQVKPEVSELDYTNAVRTADVLTPSIVVRRASTEVALKSGQSFAIAGLLSETGRTQSAQLPWIGSIPVLGALFRSEAFQNRETELVIIVTAHLTKPAKPGDKLATPLDKTLPGNDVDRFVNGRAETPKIQNHFVTQDGRVAGPYGHIIEMAPEGR